MAQGDGRPSPGPGQVAQGGTADPAQSLGQDAVAEQDFVPPFQKKYFSTDMMARYEPLMEAMVQVEETEGADEEALARFEEHWDRFMDFSWCSQWDGRRFDIVFYGASGYSGYLILEYLQRSALLRGRDNFTFALAGRSASKVAEMRDRQFVGTRWEDIPILTASFDDIVSIIDLVKSAHVVVNVAGPYILTQGEVLVDACVWCKTHYIDISAELPWSLRLAQLHRYAIDAGVAVVPNCGGSAYSDLGVYLLAKKLREDYGEATRNVVCYCSGGGTASGASGGMLRTRAAMSTLDQQTVRTLGDPFALGGFIPQVDRNGLKEVDVQLGTGFVTPKPRPEDEDINMARVSEDPKLGVWRAPYVNAFFDTRIVRRSNMLQADLGNQPYGTTLNFMEYALLPPERVAAIKRSLKEGKGELAKPMGQYGMTLDEEAAVLRKEGRHFGDGEGPDIEEMADAWTGFFLHAESTNGNQVKCSFVGGDGYWETARVAVEMALTLRFDRDKLPYRGGVLTPSVAGGTCLIERLLDSGVKFKMGEWMESYDLAPPEMGVGVS